MLDMAFGPAHFDVDCFTALVVDARAKADITRFGARAGRTVSKPQRALSTTAGHCRTAGEPGDPLAGGDLLNITALMSSIFMWAHGGQALTKNFAQLLRIQLHADDVNLRPGREATVR